MLIRFWGTRGSLPCSLNHEQFIEIIELLNEQANKLGIKNVDDLTHAVKSGQIRTPVLYGGNTTCLEVSKQDESIYIDMGSGLREAGTDAMKVGKKHFKILLTHMHWDHICGLPFFIPVHVPGSKIEIYHVHEHAPDYVKINFNGINFPVAWDMLPSEITFHKLELHKEKKIAGMKVTPLLLDHPGQCYGFHIVSGSKKFTYAVDSEFKRFTPDQLGDDLKYYQNIDLLVYDGQYAMSEIASRFDWGHSSPNLGIDLALREVARKIIFTHHDPWSTSQKIHAMESHARRYLKKQYSSFSSKWDKVDKNGPQVLMAYDGLDIDL